jgi:hypothetical protein
VFIRGNENRVAHCSFRDFWGQGVHLREGRSNIVEHCEFENFNWLLMQDGAAVFLNGEGHTVQHCRIRNTAAMGISGKQVGAHLVHGVRILHNDIADTGRVLLDGGQSAIYLNNHNAPTDQRRLDGEIAWNRIGTVHGLRDNGKGMGIYLDDGTDHADVHHNFINAGPKVRWPVFLHAAGHCCDAVKVRQNLIWGSPADKRSAAIVAIPRPNVGSFKDVEISGNVSSGPCFLVLHGKADGVALLHNTENASEERFRKLAGEMGISVSELPSVR